MDDEAQNPAAMSAFERMEYERDLEGEGPWTFAEREEGFVATYKGRVPSSPTWAMEAEFALQEPGTPMIALKIWSAGNSAPTRGIHAGVVRRLPFDALRTQARVVAQLPPNVGVGLRVHQLGPEHLSGQRLGEDTFYALWARRYIDEAKRTSKAVSSLANGHNLSPATIRSYLQQARDRQLLTEAPRGKAGGELTDKAKRLLREDESRVRERST